MPTVIDLFAGAGGLSQSLEASGWVSVAAVEIDRDAIETLRLNRSRGSLRRARLLHADIREVQRDDVRPPGAPPDWRPDLLAGGPPCQPFSSAGRLLGLADPRGRLFLEFVRLADSLKPRFILFENVAGLVTARSPDGKVGGVLARVQKEFEQIGYACRFELINAADFGAAQRRVRLYMVASCEEKIPEFPRPTHSRDGSLPYAGWESLGGLLRSMPAPEQRDIVRPNSRRAVELAALAPGTGLRAGGIVEANRPSGHWGYRQDCFVADLKLPSRTIRAASTPDWLPLPDGMRRLTWRECAALQGFPAEWQFAGNAVSRFRQIGNAVQGDVGRALGLALRRAARVVRPAEPVSVEWPRTFHKRMRYTAMEETVNGAHRRAAQQGTDATIAAAVD